MAELALEATPREPGHPNRSRRAGRVPAVVYGRGRSPQAIEVDARALRTVLSQGGQHHVVLLSGQPTIVQDVQVEATTGAIVHADFRTVALEEKIRAEVPLRLEGEERLQKRGAGVIQHQLHHLLVACRPAELPDWIAADVGGLNAGDALVVADLNPQAGVEILNAPDEVVLTVLAPRLEASEAASQPAPSEPEVVGRRGKAEQGAAE